MTVWFAVVFGINSAHNAGMKIVIVLGCTSHYYNFLPRTITIFLPALLTLLIPNTTANHTVIDIL